MLKQEQIGQMNGRWSALFKVVLTLCAVVLPMLVALNVWFVTAIYELKLAQATAAARIEAFIAEGPRYTPSMARMDNLELRASIISEIREQYPPEWLRAQVDQNKQAIEQIQREMRDGS